MVFGAVITIDQSFPTFIPISKHLDISNRHERNVASAYLQKAYAHSKNMFSKIPVPKISNEITEMALDTNKFYVKRITKTVFDRGFGMFAHNGAEHTDIGPGLFHMIECLNLLYTSESSRRIPEYIYSIRTPDETSQGCYELIFRDLKKHGYQIGAPDRGRYPDLFVRFKQALRSAVDAIHAAGVLHCDLYLSNVMWRESNDSIEIKLIDFDAAHCLNELDFAPEVKTRLSEHFKPQEVVFGISLDLFYLSVLDMDFKIEEFKQWEDLSSQDKSENDTAFWSLFADRLRL